MAHTQRYVSSELSHFVGKGMPVEEQYQLLVQKILKTGWLTYAPHDPTLPRTANLDLSRPISTDDAIKSQVVCFCDIPEAELAIHVGKYSKFGLAFRKEFLIERGACPVFYVANEGPIPVQQLFGPGDFLDRIKAAKAKGYVNRALYFDTSVRGILDLVAALDALCCEENERYFKGVSSSEFKTRFCQLLGLSSAQVASVEAALRGNTQAHQTTRMCADSLLNYVFTFMKCFDAKRSFDDEANYYMEREWRIGNNIQFTLHDVSRVFFPSSYARRFRADLPTYIGQISFIG
jgi:abortive phage resistance protein AbiGi (putative antitoxin)